MDYEYKTIEEKMLALPVDLQRALTSVDTPAIILDIATENGLHVDQIESLEELVSLVLLGLMPVRNLTSEINKSIKVPENIAQQLSNEINDKVFKAVRSSLQEIQYQSTDTRKETGKIIVNEKNTNPIPKPPIVIPASRPLPPIQTPYKNPIGFVAPSEPIPTVIPPRPVPTAPIIKPTFEQAGRFTVEKPPVGFSAQYKEQSIKPEPILKALEDPETMMVNHLLTTPVASSEKVEIKREAPPRPPVENKPYTVDPYREQF